MQEYYATQPDPERGWALAALTGELAFAEAKPGQVRALAMARVDPELFAWSLDLVGATSPRRRRRFWSGTFFYLSHRRREGFLPSG